MKVYIVNAFSAEPYEQHGGVHRVFRNYKDAVKYVENSKGLVFDKEEDGYGWFVSEYIESFEVE